MADWFNANTLFASMLWGTIASGMLLFGWKQKSSIPLAGGALMTAVTFLVSSALLMSALSLGIIGGMYWLKKQGH